MMPINLERITFNYHFNIILYSIDLQELCDLLMDNFEVLMKGKSDENKQIIAKLI